MRLIDADALLENFHKKRNPQEGADSTNQRHRYMQFLEDREAIRNAPTVDAVPVIRCKDCKYYREDGDCWHEWDNDGRIYYQSVINEPNPDDYCSRAERKEE